MTNPAIVVLVLSVGIAAVAEPGKAASPAPARPLDRRDIRSGRLIPDEGYCDQPYVVVLPGGDWLCVMTTGPGREGQPGQHVVATRSADRGRTWSKPVDIEPADGPEASWVVPLLTPAGRVYAFYTYNGDRIDRMPGREGRIRADMLGWYCFRYSDDGGRTWSERHRLPMRVTACDRANQWQGRVIIFWGICKPQALDGSVWFSFTKLGRYMLDEGEGWLMRSDNLLSQADVGQVGWEMLPAGDHGIRAEAFGSVQEEHNLVPLGDGGLYCVYRTTNGFPCETYSRNGGRTWSRPEPMRYSPGGRTIKTPRACPKLWRTADGQFLFWYHFHGGRSFAGRNPAWLSGGVLRGGRIRWSQPEIVLYDPDPELRISYPDLIEQDGRYWITETQKTEARVHEIDPELLGGLWSQGQAEQAVRRGLVAELRAGEKPVATAAMPRLPDLSAGGGWTIDLWIELGDLAPGQMILSTQSEPQSRGITLETAADGTVGIRLSDGTHSVAVRSDAGLIEARRLHHVVVIADGGPRIMSVVVDGRLCDGGAERPCGWTRLPAGLGDVNGAADARIMPLGQEGPGLRRLRIYDRYLRTSEAIANYRAGP